MFRRFPGRWNAGGLLHYMVVLDLRTARVDDAAEHLRELLYSGLRSGFDAELLLGLDCCGYLCAATGRHAEAMSRTTAAEYGLMISTGGPSPTAVGGPGGLSARERELITLVAQGRTDAQIAAELYISVRTVGSHLDRIRDKTGCRRRADLTRHALSAGLV
jgi:DNA-binding CsgD family transcriptional regulator